MSKSNPIIVIKRAHKYYADEYEAAEEEIDYFNTNIFIPPILKFIAENLISADIFMADDDMEDYSRLGGGADHEKIVELYTMRAAPHQVIKTAATQFQNAEFLNIITRKSVKINLYFFCSAEAVENFIIENSSFGSMVKYSEPPHWNIEKNITVQIICEYGDSILFQVVPRKYVKYAKVLFYIMGYEIGLKNKKILRMYNYCCAGKLEGFKNSLSAIEMPKYLKPLFDDKLDLVAKHALIKMALYSNFESEMNTLEKYYPLSPGAQHSDKKWDRVVILWVKYICGGANPDVFKVEFDLKYDDPIEYSYHFKMSFTIGHHPKIIKLSLSTEYLKVGYMHPAVDLLAGIGELYLGFKIEKDAHEDRENKEIDIKSVVKDITDVYAELFILSIRGMHLLNVIYERCDN